jgi:hypothetical protein
MAKQARSFQPHLGGVVITSMQAIPVGGGRVIQPGEEITEEAKTWPNLPGMIKRGVVKCTPEVEANSILKGVPPVGPAAIQAAIKNGGLFVMSQDEHDAARKLHVTPGSTETRDPPGTIPAGPSLAPGQLSNGLVLRLKDLTVHDSAKHVATVLREAGVEPSGNRKDMLAQRDAVVAKSEAASKVDAPAA